MNNLLYLGLGLGLGLDLVPGAMAGLGPLHGSSACWCVVPGTVVGSCQCLSYWLAVQGHCNGDGTQVDLGGPKGLDGCLSMVLATALLEEVMSKEPSAPELTAAVGLPLLAPCLWNDLWHPLTATLIPPWKETVYFIHSAMGNLLPFPFSTSYPN